MKLLRKLLTKCNFFLVLFFAYSCLFGQNYFSNHLTTNEGLPDNKVFCVFKDRDGLLWIGTDNGLVLKSGKNIKIFKKKDGLPSNSCWQITQDHLGQIWVGTFGGGLVLYQKGKLTTFDTRHGLASNKIRKLFLHQNLLYIGTSNGISTLNIQSKKIEKIEITEKTTIVKGEKKNVEILGIAEIKGKIVFNTHSHGVYIFKGKKAEILYKSLYTTFCLLKDGNDLIFTKNGFVENGEAIIKVNAPLLNSNNKLKYSVLGKSNTIFWDLVKVGNHVILGAGNGVENNTGGLYYIGNKIIKLNEKFNIKSTDVWDLFYDKKEGILYVTTLNDGLYQINLRKNILKTDAQNVIDYKANNYFKSVFLKSDGLEIKTHHNIFMINKEELYTSLKKSIAPYLPNNTDLMDNAKSGFPISGLSLKSIKLLDNKIFLRSNYGLIKIEFSFGKPTLKSYPIAAESYIFINENSLFFSFPYYSLFYVPNISDFRQYKRYENLEEPDFPKDIVNVFFTRNNKYLISRSGDLYTAYGKDFFHLKFKKIINLIV